MDAWHAIGFLYFGDPGTLLEQIPEVADEG